MKETDPFIWLLTQLRKAGEPEITAHRLETQKNIIELVFPKKSYYLKLEENSSYKLPPDPFLAFCKLTQDLDIDSVNRLISQQFADITTARQALLQQLFSVKKRRLQKTGIFNDNFLSATAGQKQIFRRVMVEQILSLFLNGVFRYSIYVNGKTMLPGFELLLFLKNYINTDLQIDCIYTQSFEITCAVYKNQVRLMSESNGRRMRKIMLANCDNLIHITTHYLESNRNFYVIAQIQNVGITLITIDDSEHIQPITDFL